MLYKEKDDKLCLDVPATDKTVTLEVTCFNATTAKVSYYYSGLKVANCGDAVDVGIANTLKGAKRAYNGNGSNPLGGKFKVKHVFTSPNGKKLTYVFPDDYTGTPAYNADDELPDYRFIVNFRAV
ncbi:MAG: hypothetical protein ABI599_02170 [Flavobacteriales bacterium]